MPAGGLTQTGGVTTLARLIGSRVRTHAPPANVRASHLLHRVRSAVAAADLSARTVGVDVGQQDGWIDTGMIMQRGERVTVVASGMLWAMRRLELGFGPEVGLWIRVGDGEVTSMLGTSMLVEADCAGPVRLLGAEPGLLDEHGDFDTTLRATRLRGSFAVAVICFDGDAAAAVVRAALADHGLFADVAARSSHPGLAPAGWSYHPRLGAAEIFRADPVAPHGEIECVTTADVGILCHPVDMVITDQLTMSWSWLVTQLPSKLPEYTEPTHDYLSVAIEFDDGRDLTWMWSSEIPSGTVFTCPLQYWRDRETHLVIRTGTLDLGHWVPEHRNIAADIAAALSPPYPARVTSIWLIANSALQRGTGACRYRDLQLTATPPPTPSSSLEKEYRQ